MRINVGDISLWFDVSGPSVLPDGDTTVERPALVTVHGGPGVDHINLKAGLSPLADQFQLVYYDQRGHGRSDASTPEFWNLPTWASDLKQLIDALGLDKPVVMGSSFGGRVVMTYAGLLPRSRRRHHPGQLGRRTLGSPAQRRDLPPAGRRRGRRHRGTRLR